LHLLAGALTALQRRTKHQLHRVWDLVIQGSLGSSSAAKQAIRSIGFTQLFRRFPNNKYVAQSDTNFLKSLTNEYQLWSDMRSRRSCCGAASS
jgi:hypothetical protein